MFSAPLAEPQRAIVASSVVGGITSAVLISATDALSMLVGPLVAGALTALWAWGVGRKGTRGFVVAGVWAVGSVAVMIGVVVISDIAYAIFG